MGNEVGTTRYLGTCGVKAYPDVAMTSRIVGVPKDLRRSVSDRLGVIILAKTILPGYRSNGAR